MENREIVFDFDGKSYVVGMGAYNKDRMVLPDGIVLEVAEGWLESMPPIPQGLKISPKSYTGMIEQIAAEVGAPIARLA